MCGGDSSLRGVGEKYVVRGLRVCDIDFKSQVLCCGGGGRREAGGKGECGVC